PAICPVACSETRATRPITADRARARQRAGHLTGPFSSSAVPGRGAGDRAALAPIGRGLCRKGVAAADLFVLAGAAGVVERAGARGDVAFAFPGRKGLIARGITDDAIPSGLVLLFVGVDVVDGRAAHSGAIEQSVLLVAEEQAAKLADPEQMAFFDFTGV